MLGATFTLGSFTGTAPITVNNVLTPGAGPAGTVGYEAVFTFAQAYRFYSFGASTVAANAANPDEELSAVGTPPVMRSPAMSTAGLGVLALVCFWGIARANRARAPRPS